MNKFCSLLAQLTPIEVALLAQQLNVSLTQDDGATPRDGAEIIDDIITTYAFSNRLRRRAIVRSVKRHHREASNAT